VTAVESSALAVGILAIVAPYLWPKMSKAVSYSLATIGFLLLGWAGILVLGEATGMKVQSGPLVLLICAGVLAAFGVFWHINLSTQSTPQPTQATHQSTPQLTQATQYPNTPTLDRASSVTITEPHGSNIVVGPTDAPVTQTIVNPPIEAATPRVLTPEQKDALKTALAAAPAATLFIPVHNSKENKTYNRQFEAIFAERGWKFMHFDTGETIRPKAQIAIYIGWRGKKSSSYLAVVRGLTDAKVDFKEGEFELSADPNIDVVAFDVGVISMTDVQMAIDRWR
jgi:hypothetical protein